MCVIVHQLSKGKAGCPFISTLPLGEFQNHPAVMGLPLLKLFQAPFSFHSKFGEACC